MNVKQFLQFSLVLVLVFLGLVGLAFFKTPEKVVASFYSPTSSLEIGENLYNQNFAIPLYTQTKNLSCESASIKMLLDYYGYNVSEDTIQESFPLHPNPHKGFRGDVDGSIWGFKDYGVYPEVVVEIMKKFGLRANAYKHMSEQTLKQKVLAGKPAIIWVDITNPKPKVQTIKVEGEEIRLVSGEHTVVVTGFKDGYWVLNDPWRRNGEDGEKLSETLYVKDLNEIHWNLLDNMAVVVD